MALELENPTAAQARGVRTRTQILDAAVRLFAQWGYEGTGIRDIETAANVRRGVVTYHFGNKDEVWKAAFNHAFMPYLDDLRSKKDLLRALDPAARRRVLVEHFVRTSAAKPYMNRLMMQENFAASWRSKWIAQRFLKPAHALTREIADDDPAMRLMQDDPHVRFAVLGACNMVFSHPCEVEALFNEDVRDEAFIERHVAVVLDMITAYLTRAASREDS